MSKIVVLGSINMDLVFSIDRMPKQGETRFAREFLMSPGGKGANQAVACAKQNSDTVLVGSIGDDPLSIQCKKSLVSYQVGCQHLSTIKNKTCGLAAILVEQGDNKIIIDSGANQVHDIKKIEAIIKTYGEKDILIGQLEIPLLVVESAFRQAKENKMTTILNAAPSLKLKETMYQLIDILVVNDIELEMQVNKTIKTHEDRLGAAHVLLKKGVGSVLITLGAKGSLFISHDQSIEVPAYDIDSVDTTAAGDTYIGAFASEISRGHTIHKAMQYATAAAALTIQILGAQRAIPIQKDVVEFLQERGYQK